jgi:hypothetical protein
MSLDGFKRHNVHTKSHDRFKYSCTSNNNGITSTILDAIVLVQVLLMRGIYDIRH